MTISKDWEAPTKVGLITSCKQAARLVSLSFERKLTLCEWAAMRVHLLMCKTCTFYMRQISGLRSVFVRHEQVLSNTPCSCEERLSPDAKTRLKDVMKNQ